MKTTIPKEITLATLPIFTARQVFEYVRKKLLKQNKKSEIIKPEDGVNQCVYRGPDGIKCAGGWCIGDDEYTSDMEGKDWFIMIDDGHVKTKDHHQLITDLQQIHDTCPVIDWEDTLKEMSQCIKGNTYTKPEN